MQAGCKVRVRFLKEIYIKELNKNLLQINHEMIDTHTLYNRSIVIKS